MRLLIDSIDDPRVTGYRSLRDRELRTAIEKQTGAFIAEGEVVLKVLLEQSRHPIESILLSELQAQRLGASLPSDVPIYVAPQALLQEIVGFPIHRGVLALGRRSAEQDIDLGSAALVLGLCGITNHDNVGGIFRNAAAFGVDAVLYDEGTCDPLYRKALRVSVGGTLRIPFRRVCDEAAVLDALIETGHEVLALSPRGDLAIGIDPPPSGKTALLLGAEGPGLSASTLARCRSARIPMQASWDSLNVAVASGIALAWMRTRVL